VSLAALVLAAGRGERLRPLTDEVPKPLLKVGGATLLDAALARVGVVVPISPETVTVNAHWLAEQIVTYVGGRVHVSVENPEALGTAGAVGAIVDWLGDRDLLVANGDVWWSAMPDLHAFVDGWDRGQPRLLVVSDEERPDFEGRWRFAGISLLPGAIARSLRPEPTGLYEQVWSRVPLDLVPADITFIDCGTMQDLHEARRLSAS
jgi:bifunctional N-acetylglucosamine-1-phosphate-uridyltransferase/glucosamine-1-phosphate-acetyltransferase GlmU-like protein